MINLELAKINQERETFDPEKVLKQTQPLLLSCPSWELFHSDPMLGVCPSSWKEPQGGMQKEN